VDPRAQHLAASHRQRRLRASRALALVLSAGVAAFSAQRSLAQTVDPDRAAKVKAAYLLNFVRYTQWPDSSFDGPSSPIVLTIVGECDAARVLREAVERSEPVDGRGLALRHLAFAGEEPGALFRNLEQSQLVYVCSLTPEQTRTILERLDAANVLTVGDTPHFAAHGGMLGFVLRGDRIIFEANPKAIHTTELTVSAKVLKLAQIVENGSRR
jgi:hypothetical protein